MAAPPALAPRRCGRWPIAAGTGTNHVSIGTDQFDPRGCVGTLPAPRRGDAAWRLTAEDAAKIAGGNYMRIFRDAVG